MRGRRNGPPCPHPIAGLVGAVVGAALVWWALLGQHDPPAATAAPPPTMAQLCQRTAEDAIPDAPGWSVASATCDAGAGTMCFQYANADGRRQW